MSTFLRSDFNYSKEFVWNTTSQMMMFTTWMKKILWWEWTKRLNKWINIKRSLNLSRLAITKTSFIRSSQRFVYVSHRVFQKSEKLIIDYLIIKLSFEKSTRTSSSFTQTIENEWTLSNAFSLEIKFSNQWWFSLKKNFNRFDIDIDFIRFTHISIMNELITSWVCTDWSTYFISKLLI